MNNVIKIGLHQKQGNYRKGAKRFFCGTVSKVVKVNAGSFIEELAAKGYCNPTQFEAVILRRGPAKASRL